MLDYKIGNIYTNNRCFWPVVLWPSCMTGLVPMITSMALGCYAVVVVGRDGHVWGLQYYRHTNIQPSLLIYSVFLVLWWPVGCLVVDHLPLVWPSHYLCYLIVLLVLQFRFP